MNYYNPYFSYPYINSISPSTTGGILGKIFGKGINWSSLLSGTQKTLSIVNQAIPLVKQVTPVMQNAKTMFKLMNEFKKVDTPTSNIPQKKETSHHQTPEILETAQNNTTINNGPTFFI